MQMRLSAHGPCTGRQARLLSSRPQAPAIRCRSVVARADGNGASLPAGTSAPVTDQAVPEGHKSLHNLLYGEGDADSHRSGARYQFREGEDDASSLVAVPAYLASREGEKPLGVYALYDGRHNLQYVGYSRNMVLAVKGHLSRVGEDRCAFIRPMVFANKAMATRANMESTVMDWLAEAGVTPPGNGVEAELWQGAVAADEPGTSLDLSLLSPAERAEYEDKRLKLRKAMGENLADDADVDADAAQRRLALMAAVEGDNWQAVISEQTQATLEAAIAAGDGRTAGRRPVLAVAAAAAEGGSGPAAVAAAAAGGGGAVVSPFSKPTVHRQVGEKQQQAAAEQAPPAEMTVESVDAALDAVRPYLLADGGDVVVAGVEGGVVAVSLQGACSSCASSSATLKMGIERQLRAVFGEQLLEVVQVDAGGGPPRASVESIDLHLNMLRSAVANLGGAVEVASVGGGVAVLRFRGPAAIGRGLVAAVRDAFPDVKEVVLQNFPASDTPQ